MELKKRVLSVLVITLAGVAPALAQVPQLLNYQGRLSSAGGPVTGDQTITFRIYDADTGGAELWSETQTVPVTDGVFNVILGSITPLADVFSGSGSRYLSVQVQGESEMTPRLQFVSSAYALRTQRADDVVDGAITEAKVQDAAITGPKIATDAVGTSKIEDGAITSAKLQDGAVRAAKLDQMGAAQGQVLKWDGSGWTPAEDSTATNGSGITEIIAGIGLAGGGTQSPVTVSIADGGVGTTQLADASITRPKIAAATVGVNEIVDSAVTSAKIQDGAVTGAKLAQPIGVGTNTPGASLEVVGGIRARGGPPGVSGQNDNGYAFGSPGDDDSGVFSSQDGVIEFYSNGVERASVNFNGLNVTGQVSSTGGVVFPDNTVQTTAVTDGSLLPKVGAFVSDVFNASTQQWELRVRANLGPSVTVTYNDTDQRYEVDVDGFPINDVGQYVILLTPVRERRFVHADATRLPGTLLISQVDTQGAALRGSFNLVVYRP